MESQLSQDYVVDSRYRGAKKAVDNNAGLRYLNEYLQRRKERLAIPSEEAVEDRFIMSGPGDSTYGFKNSFGANK